MLDNIVRPADFEGQLIDPMTDMKLCNMSDFAQFALSYESFVLPESLEAAELKCWMHLRDAIDHYCNPRWMSLVRREEFAAMSERAHECLIQYAREAERAFGTKLDTPNLHTMVCRAKRQEDVRGPLAKDNELWIERMVQFGKQLINCRGNSDPTVTIAKDTMSMMYVQSVSLVFDRFSCLCLCLGSNVNC